MNRIIETERLILRPLRVSDADAAYVWLSDAKVNCYMPYPLYTSKDDAVKWLSRLKEENNEFAYALKETGTVIGAGSIKMQEDGLWEIGYQLRYESWGMGYATEAAKALINWAYHFLGARDFMARHATANTASGNVLRKCGFVFDHFGEYSRYDGSETFEATYYKMTLK